MPSFRFTDASVGLGGGSMRTTNGVAPPDSTITSLPVTWTPFTVTWTECLPGGIVICA